MSILLSSHLQVREGEAVAQKCWTGLEREISKGARDHQPPWGVLLRSHPGSKLPWQVAVSHLPGVSALCLSGEWDVLRIRGITKGL